jgi:acetyltransferase
MLTQSLKRLFEPHSIALVGASMRAQSLGRAVLDNLVQGGFTGTIYCVNLHHPSIDERPCYPDIAALPSTPDVVIITCPRDEVMSVAHQAAQRGVSACIVITADPTPTDPRSLTHALSALARQSSMRIVGPNCLGLIAPRAHLNASFAADGIVSGDVAVISQSGAIAGTLLSWARERKLGFSALVSIGNMADVGFADLLDYFALDPFTRSILLYIEAIGDARAFMSAARAAARVKPVIIIKSGRHPRAAKAATTHTGAMAGSDAVYDAAFRRAGLLRVRDIAELFDAAESLGRIKPFEGKRLAILTNGGGIGVLAVDNLLDYGGELAELSSEARTKLDTLLPAAWSQSNPVDILGDADENLYRESLRILLDDRANDAVLVMHCPTALSRTREAAEAVAHEYTHYRSRTIVPKPLFAVWTDSTPHTDELFEAARIPHYRSGATRGFMHMVQWRENRDALMAVPPAIPDHFSPDVARARSIIQQALERGHRWLSPVEATSLFEAYQIPVAPARLARNAQDAGEVARLMLRHTPACVVKILSPDITHKSDVDGVVLNLTRVEDVIAATERMLAHIACVRPDARLEGVTIHPMISRPNARELIAGIADDETFGPVIVFGRGGKAAEIINDRALALPPLDMALARDLVSRTRVARLLKTYRDVPAADSEAVHLTLVKLAQLSADVPEVRELDLNPLLADASGVVVLDQRVSIAPIDRHKARGPNYRFAIAPYPRNWERHLKLGDGLRVFVRSVRPEDDELYRRFFMTISQEDLRLRFFAPVKEFSHAFIARLTQIDYSRALALCAIDEATGEMLGGVRLTQDVDRQSGEYAILLRSDLKGRGLGWSLMQLMIDYARSEGLKTVEGQVLSENHVMLTMCTQLGFIISDDPHEHGVKIVKLVL